MNKTVNALVAVGLGLFLLGMSHGGNQDSAAWAEGFSKFGDAMNAGNLDALAAGYAADAVRIHPLAGEVKGRDGQRGFLQFLYDNYRDQKVVVHQHSARGNIVMLETTWTAVHKESGKRVSLTEAHVIQVNGDGLIQRQRQYFDSAAFLKQLE